ncbi:MAG: TRAP transporter large permease subunit, partial [Rhodospirillaceae bacterium]|nr:TRAP transporter large permease subunit [Rhodospirillaceae bacterium]
MTDPQSGSITAEQAQEQAAEATNRHRSLSPVWMALLVTSAMSSVFMAVYVIFNLGIHVGIVPLDTQYFYAMLAALLPLVFLLYPVWPGIGPQDRVPWYDIILAAFAFSIPVYFVFTGESIIDEGWEYDAPQHAVYMTFIFWIIGLEAARRAGGLVIFLICLLFSLYPILAPYAPGFLEGEPNDWADTATYHVFGTESLIGVPMEAFANLVVGFLIFGVALQFTGGGTFFLNLAFALLGKRRGGPAKVAIFSSGLMGSMSGSVITNVLTT